MSKVYNKDFQYPVESGRYRLVFAFPCPYAQRAEIARRLLGLEEAVSLAVTSPIKTAKIWDFTNQEGSKDPVLGVTYVSELYKNTHPAYEGPFSVPALIDTSNNTVVNQESLDILRDFATRFKPLHSEDTPDIYPEELRAEIDQWIEKIAKDVLGAANRAGYARKQEEFDENAEAYFSMLEKLDAHFETNEFVIGNQISAADIVLYTPLIRHDILYVPVYGLASRKLQDYPNLWRYMKQLYNMPAFKESTNFEEYVIGQYSGKTGRIFFKREVVPLLPDMSYWEA